MLNFLETFQIFAASCSSRSFFGLPTWYKYLDGKRTRLPDGTLTCSPVLSGLNDIWLIGLAIIEILLRIAIVAAIVFVVLGGLKYITARGNSDKLTVARTSIQDALTGLAIAIAASAVVAFVAARFTSG